MNEIFSQFSAVPEVTWWLWFLICSIFCFAIIDGLFLEILPRRIALCLGGGGVTGAMYQIGALAALEDAVDDLRFLLLRQLQAVLGHTRAATRAVLSRRVGPAHDRTLCGIAEFDAVAAAELVLGSEFASHRIRRDAPWAGVRRCAG